MIKIIFKKTLFIMLQFYLQNEENKENKNIWDLKLSYNKKEIGIESFDNLDEEEE